MPAKESLASKLRAAAEEAEAAKGRHCTICALPEDIGSELRLLRKEGKSFTSLSKALAVIGTKLTAGAIQRHWREHER